MVCQAKSVPDYNHHYKKQTEVNQNLIYYNLKINLINSYQQMGKMIQIVGLIL